MNYSNFDKKILNLNTKIEEIDITSDTKKKYLEEIRNIKLNIINKREEYNKQVKSQLEQKKKVLVNKIKDLENIILLYKNKKNIIQYPYRLSRMNNDYNSYLLENKNLKKNIDTDLISLFDFHITRNKLNKKISSLTNIKYNIPKRDFFILKRWHNLLLKRIQKKILINENNIDIETDYNLKVKELESIYHKKLENLHQKLYNLKNELKILKLKPNNSQIEISINQIKIENTQKNIDILSDEKIYLESKLVDMKNTLEKKKNIKLKERRNTKEKFIETKNKLIKDNKQEIENINSSIDKLLDQKKKNESELDVLLIEKKNINEKIKLLSYDIGILKKEHKYKKELEINLLTQIKTKEIYVVNNYKQVYKYYYDIIKERQIEIINLKDEIKNLDIINDEDMNLRIKIIDNIIDKLNT